MPVPSPQTVDNWDRTDEPQMIGFRQKIERTPGWKLAGIYADEGITGTSMKKRKEFRRMLQDAQDGKLDTIITKSSATACSSDVSF